MNNYTYTGEAKKTILRAAKLKALINKLSDELDTLLPEVEKIVLERGEIIEDSEKRTVYTGDCVSDKVEAEVRYTFSYAKGGDDWKAYAIALGGTEEGVKAHQKDGNTRRRLTLNWKRASK